MRSQLEKINEIFLFETDIVAQTATIHFSPDFDWKGTLDKLAAEHEKFQEWSVK